MPNKFVRITGGAGRIICSSPSIEKLSKTHNVIVQTPHPWVFKNNPNIKMNLHLDTPAWQQYIKNSDFIEPEPYHDHYYYNQKHHLIQSFDYLLNNECDMTTPKLYLSENEKLFGYENINALKKNFKCDKVAIIQPFGQTANPNANFYDETGRSIPYTLTLKIIKMLSSCGILVFVMGVNNKELSEIPNVVCFTYTMRNWASLFNFIDYFIGCDSVGQHMARSFGVQGTVFLGQTYRENISYKYFNIIQKEGFPEEYNPFRIEVLTHNSSPFNFDHNEEKMILDDIISKIDLLD